MAAAGFAECVQGRKRQKHVFRLTGNKLYRGLGQILVALQCVKIQGILRRFFQIPRICRIQVPHTQVDTA